MDFGGCCLCVTPGRQVNLPLFTDACELWAAVFHFAKNTPMASRTSLPYPRTNEELLAILNDGYEASDPYTKPN